MSKETLDLDSVKEENATPGPWDNLNESKDSSFPPKQQRGRKMRKIVEST